ncbi:MAG: TPM domain-containing protein [Putridiphycobacter sp.]
MKKSVLTLLMLVSTVMAFSGGFPDKIGIVNDYEAVLTDSQEKSLTKIIDKNQTKLKVKMLVVTTKSFKPATTFKNYVLGLFEHWGYSPEQTTNGVLILMSYNKKELKIIPGKSIKHILTEKKMLSIVNDVMKPKFLKEKHFAGVKKGIKSIYKTIKTYQSAQS